MSSTTINPLPAARALEAAGFERKHAEAIAGTVHQAAGTDHEDLATKGGLDNLEARILWSQ